jgi:hypothetical protein
MPATSAKALATRKGFTLRESVRAGDYQVTDNTTRLPEINPGHDTLHFSLQEAVAFLRPLRDRSPIPFYQGLERSPA